MVEKVGIEKRKEREKEEERPEVDRSTRGMLREITSQAAYAIGAGQHSTTKSTVNIERIEELPTSQFVASFAHNKEVERNSVGGLGIVWVLVPKTEGEAYGKFLRRDDDAEEDFSGN